MQTTAYFSNIAEHISLKLNKAEQSIYIAVAWLTNPDLFQILIEKARDDIIVQILVSNDEINQNSRIDFSQIKIGKSSAFLVGNGKDDLMHNKFCIIDHYVVITGSYNWSKRAESNNHENIIITEGDIELAEQFITQFKKIRNNYFIYNEFIEFPVEEVKNHLQILKNYILLEDIDGVFREIKKLTKYNFNKDILLIISALKKNLLTDAIKIIDNFITCHHQLNIHNDLELSSLKLNLLNLQYQANAYDDKKIELESILAQFQNRHTKELGEYISKLLNLRKMKAFMDKDEDKYIEVERYEREYNEQLLQEDKKKIFELDNEGKRELKIIYKKASILCHPDKVHEELKELAEITFNRLKSSYEDNDLATVKKIFADLQKGKLAKRADSINEKEKIKAKIQELKEKIAYLEREIFTIQDSKEYKMIMEIDNWDVYFSNIKSQLINEIERIS